MKVVVTGSTGYLGTRLLKLLELQKAEFRIIGRQDTDAQITEMLKSFSPEAVIHLASYYVAEHFQADVVPLVRSNIEFGARVLECMREAKVTNIVVAGSAWQDGYGEFVPNSLYAATKNCFEHIVQCYCRQHDFRMISLRIFDSAGPLDPRPKLLNVLAKSKPNASEFALSPGDQMIHMVHADDIAAGFIKAVGQMQQMDPGTFSTFDLRSLEALSLRELVLKLEAHLGRSLPIQWGAKPYRKNEVMRPYEEHSRLPGWTPKRDLTAIFNDLTKLE